MKILKNMEIDPIRRTAFANAVQQLHRNIRNHPRLPYDTLSNFSSKTAFENPVLTRGYGATILAMHKLHKAGQQLCTWEQIQLALHKRPTSNASSRSAYIVAGLIEKKRDGRHIKYRLTALAEQYLFGWLGL